MAVLGPGVDIGFLKAGEDLSALQYRFVTLNTITGLVKCSMDDGQPALGIQLDKAALGKAVQIRVVGCAKLAMAETCDPMDLLMPNDVGRGIVADTAFVNSTDPSPSDLSVQGDYVNAIALAPSTGSGDIIEVLVVHGGIAPVTP